MVTIDEVESLLVAKINCSDSPICAVWCAMNFLTKRPYVVHENKIGKIVIMKIDMKGIARALGRFNISFLSLGTISLDISFFGEDYFRRTIRKNPQHLSPFIDSF